MSHEQLKRKTPRLQVSLRSSILIAGKSFYTETYELGEAGMSFLHCESVELSREVAVVLYFSQASELLNVIATVKSCEKYGNDYRVGVQFETMNFGSSTKLRRFITGRAGF